VWWLASRSTATAAPRSPLAPPANFDQLAAEYRRDYATATVRPERVAALDQLARQLVSHEARYRQVADPLGVPWWILGAIHQLEHSGRWTTALDVTDRIDVPPGEPVPEGRILDAEWNASATRELRRQSFDRWRDWSLPGSLYMLERFNGFGYRSHRVATPYLWSYTTLYDRGKFIRARVFDPDVVSAQPGAAAMLKRLVALGFVAAPA
jgi:lysozyme family protein